MRRFLGILGALIAFSAHAQVVSKFQPSQLLLLGPRTVNINFLPTAFPGLPSVFLGDTQNYPGATATTSNYLTTPAAAFELPTQLLETALTDPGCHALAPNKVCGWTVLLKFRYTANAFPAPQNSTNPLALGGNCGGVCINGLGSTDRFLAITSPGASTTQSMNNQLFFNGNAANGSANLWTSPIAGNQTGLQAIPGHDYCVAVTQYGADSAAVSGSAADGVMSIALNDAASGPVAGSPVIVTGPNDTANGNNWYFTAAVIRTKASTNPMGSILANIGVMSTNGVNAHGNPGPFADATMIYGTLPNAGGTPTAALLQHFCDGSETFAQWYAEMLTDASAGGFPVPIVNAHYPLNPSVGVTLADTVTVPTVTTALGTAGAATYLAASPLTQSPALTITDFGAGDVFRVEPGSGAVGATGTIYRSGTYNVSALGGTPTGFQGVVLQNGVSVSGAWQSIETSPTGGIWHGAISGLGASYLTTAGGNTQNIVPYNFCVRATNAPGYEICSSESDYIGLVEPDLGQSEKALMYNTGNIESSNSVKIPTGDIVFVALGAFSISDPVATPANAYTNNCVTGYSGCPNGQGPTFAVRQVISSASGPQNQIGSGTIPAICSGTCLNTAVGDGAAEKAVALATIANLPVRIGYIGKTGTPVDAWLMGYQTDGGAVTDSAGTLSYTAVMTNPVNPATGTAGFFPTGGWISGAYYAIRPGTVVLKDATGCVFGNDAGAAMAATGTLVAVANSCAGSPVLTAGGTITYSPVGVATSVPPSFTGATVSGSPTLPIAVSYTTLEDVVSAAYARQTSITTNGGGLFTGLDFAGSGTTPGTGLIINQLNQWSGPPNAWNVEQANANMSFGLNTVPAPATNTSAYFATFQSEWECVVTKCVVGNSIMARYWWYGPTQQANTPIDAEGYSRDTAAIYSQWQGANQYFQNWGSSATNGGLTTPHVFGGTYDDICNQALLLGVGSPHQDGSLCGTLRMGGREGVDEWYNYLGQSAPEPTIATAVWTSDTTYHAGCATGPGCIRITIALSAVEIAGGVDRVETCGTTLLGTGAGTSASPANGSCTATDYTSTPTIYGFSFGLSSSGTFYTTLGNDDSSISTALPNSDGQQIPCTLVAKLIVECVPTVPANFSAYPGSTWAKYNTNWNLNGSLASISLSGYTGWTGSSPFGPVATSGGACSTHPTVELVNTAGTLSAFRVTRGVCTTADTTVSVAHFTGGLTGTQTLTFSTPATDITQMGSKLYGADALANYAIGISNAATIYGLTNAPGQPVTTLNRPNAFNGGVAF